MWKPIKVLGYKASMRTIDNKTEIKCEIIEPPNKIEFYASNQGECSCKLNGTEALIGNISYTQKLFDLFHSAIDVEAFKNEIARLANENNK